MEASHDSKIGELGFLLHVFRHSIKRIKDFLLRYEQCQAVCSPILKP